VRIRIAATDHPERVRRRSTPLGYVTGMAARDPRREYLARAVAALTPAGRRRVDALLDQLAAAGSGRESLVRFAQARRTEADLGRVGPADDVDPPPLFSPQERDVLIAGFMAIRDQEPLDDVTDWANAVILLLEA
jgi:hypothetical protein